MPSVIFNAVMLINIVEVSNVFSVLIVFLVFCAMVVFILRLQDGGFTMTSVHYSARVPAGPLPVIKIFNPFAFRLQARECTFNDIVCVVSSQVPWAMMPLWGVNVARIHRAIANGRSWNSMKAELLNDGERESEIGDLVDDADDETVCICRGRLQRHPKCADLTMHLSPTIAVNSGDLGRPPRSRYPFVVVLIDPSESVRNDTTSVGAMIIVVHIKDDVCTAESSIIAQYLKMTNGQLSDLKQLYVPDHDDDDEDNDDNTNGVQSDGDFRSSSSPSTGAMCLICRTLPASRALLPCRHVCSCSRCFEHLDKCPMCRSFIETYFCIRDEAATELSVNGLQDVPLMAAGEGPLEQQQQQDWYRRFQRWNEWINRTLGFT